MTSPHIATAAEEATYWNGTSTGTDADGGDGEWNNSNTNWNDLATAGADISWDANNSNDDTANFGAAAGTVTLSEAINLKNLKNLNITKLIPATRITPHLLIFVRFILLFVYFSK